MKYHTHLLYPNTKDLGVTNSHGNVMGIPTGMTVGIPMGISVEIPVGSPTLVHQIGNRS